MIDRRAALLVTASLAVPASTNAQEPAAPGGHAPPGSLERITGQNNPTLQQAAAAVRAAEGRRMQAGAWPNPMVGVAVKDAGGPITDWRSMMRRLAFFLMFVALLSVGGVAAAHEGHSHGKVHKMIGTVKAVHAEMNHVQITTKNGKTEEFYVNADTKYLKGSTKLSLSDLTPGTRVVVDAKLDGQRMVATVIKVGGSTKTATKSSTHQHR